MNLKWKTQTAIEAVYEFTQGTGLVVQHQFVIIALTRKNSTKDVDSKSYADRSRQKSKNSKALPIIRKGLDRDSASILGINLKLMKLAPSQGSTKLHLTGLEIQETVHLEVQVDQAAEEAHYERSQEVQLTLLKVIPLKAS